MASLPATAARVPTGSTTLRRLPLIALGITALVFGTLAGLARLGWQVPATAALAAPVHGPLMVGAFLGVVIALERAVAIGRGWALLGPGLAGAGGVLAIIGPFLPIGDAAAAPVALPALGTLAPLLLTLGSGVLVGASLSVVRRQPTLFNAVIGTGAACWAIGNVLWLAGGAVHDVLPWWLSFLVLTIAGERLELSRFLPPAPRARRLFVAIVALLLVALALHTVALVASARGATPPAAPARAPLVAWALALVALASWLFRNDLARRTVTKQGLTRYCAVCLLSGYAWLAAGGALVLWANVGALVASAGAAAAWSPGSPLYDAGIHALALGFVFSMVFGHAPIVLPAVLRVPLPYHPAFYVPLLLLHASLAVRLAGDLLLIPGVLRVGGLLNAIAIGLFMAGTLTSVLRARAASADTRMT